MWKTVRWNFLCSSSVFMSHFPFSPFLSFWNVLLALKCKTSRCFSFCVSFIVVWSTQTETRTCQGYSLDFDKCEHQGHHHTQDLDFHHPRTFLCVPLLPVPCHSQTQATSQFFHSLQICFALRLVFKNWAPNVKIETNFLCPAPPKKNLNTCFHPLSPLFSKRTF